MIKIDFLIFIFLSFNCIKAFTQNPPPGKYKLILAENEHFRPWTFLELKNKITINQDVIDLNKCNRSEKLLFPDLVKSNTKAYSLRIASSDNKNIYTFSDMNVLNNKDEKIEIEKINDQFVREVIRLLNNLYKIDSGKKLIQRLQKALYTVTIIKGGSPRFEIIGSDPRPNFGFEEAAALQHFVVLRKSGQIQIPFSQFGSGGNIRFDTKFKMQSIESDGVSRDIPSIIILAHEMFHAYDGVRGLLDRRFVNGVNMESTEVSEFRATYFENQIRKSLGKKYRKFYSTSAEKLKTEFKNNKLVASLLDKNGEPYLFPTPCLK